MQYVITPHARFLEPFVWQEKVFNDAELNWLQTYAAKAEIPAVVGGSNNPEEIKDIRRSNVSWLSCNNDTKWVFEKLAETVSSVNAQWFNFNISGFGEAIQMTTYKEENNGMYDWHQDYNCNISRKLSVVCQLSDPSEYDGGNLEIMTGKQPITVRKQRGFVVVFPSFNLHRVTPVTRGSRQSLVTWVTGVPFK